MDKHEYITNITLYEMLPDIYYNVNVALFGLDESSPYKK